MGDDRGEAAVVRIGRWMLYAALGVYGFLLGMIVGIVVSPTLTMAAQMVALWCLRWMFNIPLE